MARTKVRSSRLKGRVEGKKVYEYRGKTYTLADEKNTAQQHQKEQDRIDEEIMEKFIKEIR